MKGILPRQYIEGSVNFFGYDFFVTQDVLIPRPETEILVEEAIRLSGAVASGRCVRILDLGTGSANIAISLQNEVKGCKIFASDISVKALEIAKRNASLNGVEGRIEFIESDIFKNIRGLFDIIISNPPYVAREEFEELPPEVLTEPALALDGGRGGLDFFKAIISEAPDYLMPGGYISLEIGYGQRQAVEDLIDLSGLELIGVKKDYCRIDRVITARKHG